ncbi:hypothetical protein L6452_42364 [Arctium lappa]|uniref:Uncharacterized protein n=1 Tax=Arctium lappa TaxID=4217 RepID=A0ACB8XJ73_ARCLA|nr:hypothetical protein L6452_42364 [Arctium lappa]
MVERGSEEDWAVQESGIDGKIQDIRADEQEEEKEVENDNKVEKENEKTNQMGSEAEGHRKKTTPATGISSETTTTGRGGDESMGVGDTIMCSNPKKQSEGPDRIQNRDANSIQRKQKEFRRDEGRHGNGS